MAKQETQSPSSTPENLALAELSELLGELSTPRVDLRAVVPRCEHVCILLDWDDNQAWFRAELYGFPLSMDLPWYRRAVPGYIDWRPEGMHALIRKIVEENSDGSAPKEQVTRDAFWGLEDLIAYAEKGVAIPTGRDDERWSRVDRKSVPVREVVVIEAATMQRVLANLRTEIFRWASRAYKAIRFGDAAGDIWRSYRGRVDEALAKIGLGGHLDAINRGLSSPEPQEWRQAMWSCRDLMRDFATHLWRLSGETYPNLQDDKGKPIKVTPDRYVNRLMAYLHHKGVTGTTGAYLRAEVARIHALNDLDSKAHEPVDQDEARLGVIATYTFLGEFVTRTDMEPVVELIGNQ